MKNKKSTLLLLLLVLISLVLSSCCGNGECPFRKIFGSKESQTQQPSGTTAPAPSTETGNK